MINNTCMDRRTFIGASDVASICGLNPFKTALQLWAEKTGKIEQAPMETEAMEWGRRLEQAKVISQKFEEVHNVKLIARKARYFHPQYLYISCELDNIIAGTDELVEIKTTSGFNIGKWQEDDEIPEYILVQVQIQLGLSLRKTGWVACLIGGSKYIEKKIQFDESIYNSLVVKCVEFWDLVQRDIPPPATAKDNQSLIDIYPSSDEQIQEVEEMNDCISLLQKTKADMKELENIKDECEVKLKEVIKENLGIKTKEYIVKWAPQISTKLNIEKIKADNLYEKYAEKKEIRVLRIAKNKEG